MKNMVRNAAGAAAIAVSGLVSLATPAQAYPIDCAILLCLAGGWPSSVPCAQAQAEFIRRITPWPIEPPLQIWRCPMGASFSSPAALAPTERLFDIAARPEPSTGLALDTLPLRLVQAEGRADIDISADAFDFVRSIRVFHIQYNQGESRDERCGHHDSTQLGSYGLQGDFHWEESSVALVPEHAALAVPGGCTDYLYRSVFVEWRDHAGTYGFEEVRY